MKYTVRLLSILLLCMIMVFSGFAGRVSAEENVPETDPADPGEAAMAEEVGSSLLVTGYESFADFRQMFDKKHGFWQETAGPCSMTLSYETGIGSLYVMFAEPLGQYSLTNEDTGVTVTCGEYNFMHDFLDLTALFGTAPKSVTLSFTSETVCIRELYVFTPGQVPDFVQKWKAPAEGRADLVLFSTHGDDEHLFFAGLLPYYGVVKGYQVQVVYLTDHHNNSGTQRMMEMLDGLWSIGLDTYPVFGPFEDFYLMDKTEGYLGFKGYGWSKEDLLGFVVENIRRFRPMVAVGHDFAGEYGHVQHIVYADLLSQAIKVSMDPEAFPESAEKYGTWDVPKTYFHLYKENEIVMDWDQPSEKLGGQTPFEASIYSGFAQHMSQLDSFMWYYYGYTKASQIRLFNPCYYGLYRTTAGPDTQKNDMFENLTTHAELARIAEEKRLAEEAKRAEEEAARLKAEAEAKAKAEEEAKRLAELEAQQKAQLEKEATEQNNRIILAVAACVLGAAIFAGILLSAFTKNKLK